MKTLAELAHWLQVLPRRDFLLGAVVMGVLALIACYFAFRNLSRSRLIADLATAKARSAPQGYVELEGHARAMPGDPIYAPLSGRLCVWWRYSVEFHGRDGFRDSEGWSVIEDGVSEGIFHLADQSGVCVVDPEGAEVTPSIKLCWRGASERPLFTPDKNDWLSRLFSFGPYRYIEHRIEVDDHIYALGQYSSVADTESLSINEQIRDLLAAWKRDKAGLLRRFDTNRDGQIDLQEWERARLEAEREVLSTANERSANNELNVLRKPSNGRPFLLSCLPQEKLIALYRLRAVLAILLFFALGASLTWAVNVRLAASHPPPRPTPPATFESE